MNTSSESFNELVDVHQIGPHIDINWYKHIQRGDKPYMPALIILADVVYWSRPTVIRDEVTNQIVKYKRKTKLDYLLRTSTDYNLLYGLTRKQVGDARKILIDLNLIELEEKFHQTPKGKSVSDGYLTAPIIHNIKEIKNEPTPVPTGTTPVPPGASNKELPTKGTKKKLLRNLKGTTEQSSSVPTDFDSEKPTNLDSTKSDSLRSSSFDIKRDRALFKKTPLNNTKSTKNINKPVEHKRIPKRIINLILMWNDIPHFTTHVLKETGTRNRGYYLDEQTKTIQNIVKMIQSVLNKSFFNKHTVDKQYLTKTKLPDIRKSMETYAYACSAECQHKVFKASMLQFFYGEYAQVLQGKQKYVFKYPFLHWAFNAPKTVASKQFKSKTKYKRTVEKILTLVGRPSDNAAHNKIVKYVDEAIVMLKTNSKRTGKFMDNIGEIPQRVAEGAGSERLSMDNIHWGFVNLERTYRKHLKF